MASNQNNASLNEQWSNIKCVQISLEDNFPSAVEDSAVQKKIVESFLDFYLGARLQKGTSVYDLVYSVISIMPLHHRTEDFIWSKVHYKEDGTLFFLSAEDKLKADVKAALDRTAKANEKNVTNNGIPCTVLQEDSPSETVSKGSLITDTEHKDTPAGKTQSYEKFVSQETFDTNKQSNSNPYETIEAPKLPQNLTWFSVDRRHRERSTIKTGRLPYGALENAAFNADCNNLLRQWDTNKTGRIFLKYFLGVVGLTMLRATTKSYKHLVDTFSSEKFYNYIQHDENDLRLCKIEFHYTVPDKRCIKYCYRTFSKRGLGIRVMFAKIVVNSYRIDAFRKRSTMNTDPLKCNIFKVSVLAHTSFYGMGLVSLAQDVRKFTEDMNKVMKYTYCASTKDSWKTLSKFTHEYMISTCRQCTHYWARLIDMNYFQDLACSKNYELSVILAVFVEKQTKNSNVWKSSWLKSKRNNEDPVANNGDNDEYLATLKEQGSKLYEKWREDKEARPEINVVGASGSASVGGTADETELLRHLETAEEKKFIHAISKRKPLEKLIEELQDLQEIFDFEEDVDGRDFDFQNLDDGRDFDFQDLDDARDFDHDYDYNDAELESDRFDFN